MSTRRAREVKELLETWIFLGTIDGGQIVLQIRDLI